MSNRLLIIGASARAAAFSAHQAGFKVLTADLFADVDLARFAESAVKVKDYPSDFENALAHESFDLWMMTGALENYPSLLQRWSARFPGYCGCNPEAIRMVRSDCWRTVLEDAGLSVPKQSDIAPPASDLPNWLVKDRRSASGLQIERPNLRPQGEEPQRLAKQDNKYFQRFVPGTPMSAVYVATDTRSELLCVSEQLIGHAWGAPSEFCFVGAIGPLAPAPDLLKQWRCIGNELSTRCGLRGVFGVDAIVNGNKVLPIEVNPRYPASAELFDRAHAGQTVAEIHMKALTEPDRFSSWRRPASMNGQVHAKAILWAQKEMRIRDLKSLVEASGPKQARIADIPRPGIITAGQPIATVFAAGATQEVARKRLWRRMNAMQRWMVLH